MIVPLSCKTRNAFWVPLVETVPSREPMGAHAGSPYPYHAPSRCSTIGVMMIQNGIVAAKASVDTATVDAPSRT